MKKIFITTAMIALLGSTSVFADGGKKATKVTTVSYSVENEFTSDFSDAKNVSWSITPNVQKATFTQDGVKMTAFYSLQGDYMGVTQNVDYAALSDKAKAIIADKYKDYSVKEVVKLETTNPDANFEETNYFVDLKNGADEILVRVTASADVYFFQQVK